MSIRHVIVRGAWRVMRPTEHLTVLNQAETDTPQTWPTETLLVNSKAPGKTVLHATFVG